MAKPDSLSATVINFSRKYQFLDNVAAKSSKTRCGPAGAGTLRCHSVRHPVLRKRAIPALLSVEASSGPLMGIYRSHRFFPRRTTTLLTRHWSGSAGRGVPGPFGPLSGRSFQPAEASGGISIGWKRRGHSPPWQDEGGFSPHLLIDQWNGCGPATSDRSASSSLAS